MMQHKDDTTAAGQQRCSPARDRGRPHTSLARQAFKAAPALARARRAVACPDARALQCHVMQRSHGSFCHPCSRRRTHNCKQKPRNVIRAHRQPLVSTSAYAASSLRRCTQSCIHMSIPRSIRRGSCTGWGRCPLRPQTWQGQARRRRAPSELRATEPAAASLLLQTATTAKKMRPRRRAEVLTQWGEDASHQPNAIFQLAQRRSQNRGCEHTRCRT
jgi:hypothetical protein